MEKDAKEGKKKQEEETIGKKEIIKSFLIFAILLILFTKIIPTYVVSGTIVDGESMQNTLQPKQVLVISKFSYQVNEPKRFDIVTLQPFGLDDESQFIKRIIGLPGETIQIKDEQIYINGKVLKENFGKEPTKVQGIAKNPVMLGKDEYFVMGDNRNESGDSREEFIGPIKRELILGKAVLRVFPFNKFGTIE